MLAGIASLVFIPILSVAMVHFLWAFGSPFPLSNEADLAKLVIGRDGIEKMPPKLLTLLVALMISLAGLWALLLSDPVPNATLVAGGIFFALLFGLRGLAAYLPFWARLTPEPNFRSSDRKVYGPLCLYIGVGFALLTLLNATPIAG